MYFTKENHDDVVVEIVELSRATVNEAKEFVQTLEKDLDSGYKKKLLLIFLPVNLLIQPSLVLWLFLSRK